MPNRIRYATAGGFSDLPFKWRDRQQHRESRQFTVKTVAPPPDRPDPGQGMENTVERIRLRSPGAPADTSVGEKPPSGLVFYLALAAALILFIVCGVVLMAHSLAPSSTARLPLVATDH